MVDPLRLLEKIKLEPHYLWSAAHDQDGRRMFEQYVMFEVLHEDVGLQALKQLDAEALYREFLGGAYAKLDNFKDPALGALYWAIVAAVHATMSLYKQGSHEPFLNGALMGSIAQFTKQARPTGSTESEGLRDLTTLSFSDQAARGNEAYSGADFGLIMEVRRSDDVRIHAVLIQAKRASGRKVDVRRKAGDSSQWTRLNDGGIGAYLFYNEHGPKGPLPITIKSRSLVEARDKESAVDPIEHATELASWIAFGVSQGYAIGPQRVTDREDALRMIFNPERGKARVNDVLVAVLDEEKFTPADLRQIEMEWESLVAAARADIADGHRPFEHRSPKAPPRTD